MATAADAELAGTRAALTARDVELARLQVAHRRQGADLLDERERVLVLQEEVCGTIGQVLRTRETEHECDTISTLSGPTPRWNTRTCH
jgi:hypothetical protein